MPRDQIDISPLEFVPLAADHLAVLSPGDPAIAANYDRLFTQYAWTALWHGQPIVAAGIVPHTVANYGEAWALVLPDLKAPGRVWVPITSRVRLELARAKADGLRLVECTVDANFPAALRWARRLGFEANGLRPNYAGRDCILFGRN